jgi:hypothetical protein
MVALRLSIYAAIGWFLHPSRGRPTTGYGRFAAVELINLELEVKIRQETQYVGASTHGATPRDLDHTLEYIREEGGKHIG